MGFYQPFTFQAIADTQLNIWNLLTRIFISLLAGWLIGYFQEKRGHAAGLRTHLVISLASCVLVILSIYLAEVFSDVDPSRIAAQVISGIGFLGAGAIIKSGFNIMGMTSAASIWAMAAVGMTAGSGFYEISLLCAGLLLVIIKVFGIFEKKVMKVRGDISNLIINFKGIDTDRYYLLVKEVLKKHKIKIKKFSLRMHKDRDQVKIKMLVKGIRKRCVVNAVEELRGEEIIKQIIFDYE